MLARYHIIELYMMRNWTVASSMKYIQSLLVYHQAAEIGHELPFMVSRVSAIEISQPHLNGLMNDEPGVVLFAE